MNASVVSEMTVTAMPTPTLPARVPSALPPLAVLLPLCAAPAWMVWAPVVVTVPEPAR